MPHEKTVRLYRALAAGNTPGPLSDGELALDALSDPPRLYTPVPTSRDPTGRINLLDIAGGGGLSSFAPTTAAFTVPAVGASVTIALEQTAWCAIGAFVFVGGMIGVITAVTSTTITVLRVEAAPETPVVVLPPITGNGTTASPLTVNLTALQTSIATLEGNVTALQGRATTLESDVGTLSTRLNALPLMASANSPVMLAAANGVATLVGQPTLSRFGSLVTWTFNGNNKATATANTISLAEVPPGFRPTSNVTQAIQQPAGNITVQQYTGATTVFPDTPGANQAAGGQRWSVRLSINFTANTAMSAAVSWQTTDAAP